MNTLPDFQSRPHFYNSPQVHTDRDNDSCKFWLDPVALSSNLGFSAKELRDIEKIIIENQQHLLKFKKIL
jgi:hypothetical protein